MTAPTQATAREAVELPPLPHTDKNYWQPVANGTGWIPGFSSNTGPADGWEVTKYYTADQMRAYALSALAAKQEELDKMREALEEIALAGMSPSPEMSQDGVEAWHARQAWRFIGIAARAISPARAALSPSQQGEPR